MEYVMIAAGLYFAVVVFTNVVVSSPMIVWGGDEFFQTWEGYRTLAICGRYGLGKTLTAVALSCALRSRGQVQKIITNFSAIVAESELLLPIEYACFIVDECQNYLQLQEKAKKAAAFLRKDHLFVIASGIDVPNRLLNRFRLSVYWDFSPFGLDIVRFKWYADRSGGGYISGYFWMIGIKRVYGFYDTFDKPVDDGGLELALTVNEICDNAAKLGMDEQQISNLVTLIMQEGEGDDETASKILTRSKAGEGERQAATYIRRIAETVENTQFEVDRLNSKVDEVRTDNRASRK